MQYQMEASFVEIYNETLRDLLATSTGDGDTKHEIKMDPSRPGEVYITNITPVQVTSEDQVCGLPACYMEYIFVHLVKFCICNYTGVVAYQLYLEILASFPGPAQLSVAFSTEKQERAWYLFSRE